MKVILLKKILPLSVVVQLSLALSISAQEIGLQLYSLREQFKTDVGIAEIMRTAKKAGVKQYFIEDESSISVVQSTQSLKFLSSIKY